MIVGAVTPVNTSTLSHTLKLSENTTLHTQNPTAYENEAGKRFVEVFPEMALETEKYFEGAMTSTLEMTTTAGQGAIEIKA